MLWQFYCARVKVLCPFFLFQVYDLTFPRADQGPEHGPFSGSSHNCNDKKGKQAGGAEAAVFVRCEQAPAVFSRPRLGGHFGCLLLRAGRGHSREWPACSLLS